MLAVLMSLAGCGLIGSQSRVLALARPGTPVDRRALLRTLAAASSAALASSFLAPQRPALAAFLAPVKNEDELVEAVMLIARVMEATEQEERLINSGKYKDLQRKSVKNAATMMLENYALPQNLVRASIFVSQESVAEATRLGQEATEALNQIIGYFPAELSVGELERVQKEFVLSALRAARTDLVAFIALLPAKPVQAAFAQVRSENELNAKDYERIFGEPMLNIPSDRPAKAAKPAAPAKAAKKASGKKTQPAE